MTVKWNLGMINADLLKIPILQANGDRIVSPSDFKGPGVYCVQHPALGTADSNNSLFYFISDLDDRWNRSDRLISDEQIENTVDAEEDQPDLVEGRLRDARTWQEVCRIIGIDPPKCTDACPACAIKGG